MQASRVSIYLALVAVYLIWGSTYLGIRFAIETLPPFLMSGVRFLIAGLLLFGWFLLRGRPRPSLQQWRSAAVSSGLMLLCGNGAVAWAEQHIPSGIAALLVATTPFWMVLLDWLWQKNTRPTLRIFLGLLMGLAGIAVLSDPLSSDAARELDLFGIVAVLFASLAWAVGSLYSRRAPQPAHALTGIAIQMITGGLWLLAMGTVIGEWQLLDIASISLRSLLAGGYLIVFGSMIAFSCYLWLLKVAPASMVATYAYVNPVVAVFLGWLLAGEAVSGRTFAASAIIIIAVILITFRRPRRTRTSPSAPPPPRMENARLSSAGETSC